MNEIKDRIRKIQEKNIKRVYIPNGDFRRLELAIDKSFIKILENLKGKWKIESKELEIMSGDVAYLAVSELIDNIISKIENNSPSQQISVDKREVVHTKETSDVGLNPTSDTSNTKNY